MKEFNTGVKHNSKYKKTSHHQKHKQATRFKGMNPSSSGKKERAMKARLHLLS